MKLYLMALIVVSAMFMWTVWILYSNIQISMGVVEQVLTK